MNGNQFEIEGNGMLKENRESIFIWQMDEDFLRVKWVFVVVSISSLFILLLFIVNLKT